MQANFQMRPAPARRLPLPSRRNGRALHPAFARQEMEYPYLASGPIFAAPRAISIHAEPNDIPASMANRFLSLKAYDGDGSEKAVTVCHGSDVHAAILRLFADAQVESLHINYAVAGRYLCRVDRVRGCAG